MIENGVVQGFLKDTDSEKWQPILNTQPSSAILKNPPANPELIRWYTKWRQDAIARTKAFVNAKQELEKHEKLLSEVKANRRTQLEEEQKCFSKDLPESPSVDGFSKDYQDDCKLMITFDEIAKNTIADANRRNTASRIFSVENYLLSPESDPELTRYYDRVRTAEKNYNKIKQDLDWAKKYFSGIKLFEAWCEDKRIASKMPGYQHSARDLIDLNRITKECAVGPFEAELEKRRLYNLIYRLKRKRAYWADVYFKYVKYLPQVTGSSLNPLALVDWAYADADHKTFTVKDSEQKTTAENYQPPPLPISRYTKKPIDYSSCPEQLFLILEKSKAGDMRALLHKYVWHVSEDTSTQNSKSSESVPGLQKSSSLETAYNNTGTYNETYSYGKYMPLPFKCSTTENRQWPKAVSVYVRNIPGREEIYSLQQKQYKRIDKRRYNGVKEQTVLLPELKQYPKGAIEKDKTNEFGEIKLNMSGCICLVGYREFNHVQEHNIKFSNVLQELKQSIPEFYPGEPKEHAVCDLREYFPNEFSMLPNYLQERILMQLRMTSSHRCKLPNESDVSTVTRENLLTQLKESLDDYAKIYKGLNPLDGIKGVLPGLLNSSAVGWLGDRQDETICKQFDMGWNLDQRPDVIEKGKISLQGLGFSNVHLKNTVVKKLLSQFTELDLSGNSFTSLSDFEEMYDLVKLNLSKNSISGILTNNYWFNGTHLNLSCNKLTSIPKVSYCVNLTCLNLSNNQIGSELMHFPKSLTHLDLSNNKIEFLDCQSIPDGLSLFCIADNPVATDTFTIVEIELKFPKLQLITKLDQKVIKADGY